MCHDYSRWQTRKAGYRARFENPADNTDDIVPRYTILRNVPPRDLYVYTYLAVQTWRLSALSNRAMTDDRSALTSTGGEQFLSNETFNFEH